MTDGLAKSKQPDIYLEFLKQNLSLIKRILSALVLAPIVVYCIFFGSFVFMALVLLAATVTSHEWYNMVKDLKNGTALMVFGMVYIAISFSSFIFLRFGFEQGAWITLVVMLSVWSSDIMAYVFGKTFKGPRMCPQISPNKTWAGLGGSVFGFASVLTVAMLYIPLGLHAVPVYVLLPIGAFLGIAAQGGDLLVSRLKRQAGIKDTGQLIPGHGGLLDRIDALLLIAPISALLLIALQG